MSAAQKLLDQYIEDNPQNYRYKMYERIFNLQNQKKVIDELIGECCYVQSDAIELLEELKSNRDQNIKALTDAYNLLNGQGC